MVFLALPTVTSLLAQVVTSQDPNRVSAGFVMLAPTASETTYLVRNDGSIAHTWPSGGPPGVAVRFLPGGELLRTGTISSSVFFEGKGVGGRLEKRTWDGQLTWSYTLPSPEKYILHHDIDVLPNGNVLAIAWELRTKAEAVAAGRAASNTPEGGIWSEAIFEIRPDVPSGGTIVWEWHVWDHLVQDIRPADANFGTVARNYRRIDINYDGSNANPATDPDWLHLNAVTYNAELDQILISSRPWSEIWIIDHSTTTAEAATASGGKRGHGGDLLYRWGNPHSYRAGPLESQQLFNQHDAHWIAADLPGAGNVLVFNNGVGRGYASSDELKLPVDENGNYIVRSDGTFGPAKPAWTFGANAGPNFFSLTAGSSQRLRNGNTLVCLPNAARVVEATQEGDIVWDLNLGAGEAGGFTFRATRFPADTEQFVDTELALKAPEIRNAASHTASILAPGALGVAEGTGFAEEPEVAVTDAKGVTRPARTVAVETSTVTFQVPRDAAPGPARVEVEAADGGTQRQDFRINTVAPAIFSANGDGEGVGAIIAIIDAPAGRLIREAYRLDRTTNRYVPDPLALTGQTFLSLFGTGISSSPATPAVRVGDVAVPVQSVTPLPEFLGLDQVNIGPLPASLSGMSNTPITITVDGATANEVVVSFQ